MGYCGIDTITLNADKLPDFIYCYQMEEYMTIGLLISDEKHSYKNIDVINVFSPEIGENFVLNKNEILKDYILKDINGKGRPSLLTNVIEKEGMCFPVKNFTDTIPYSELQARAEGKLKGLRSRGILLSPTK
jgi:hypothetical protein